jgi:hypothetical protein
LAVAQLGATPIHVNVSIEGIIFQTSICAVDDYQALRGTG